MWRITAVLENGQVVAEGEAAALRATSHVIEAYLGAGGDQPRRILPREAGEGDHAKHGCISKI